MRDYSKFRITVRGEPKFAFFLQSMRDRELKKRIDDALGVLKERRDVGQGSLCLRRDNPSDAGMQMLARDSHCFLSFSPY